MKIMMIGSGSPGSSLSHRLEMLGLELSELGHRIAIILPRADKYNSFRAQKKSELNKNIIRPWQFTTRSTVINFLPYLLTSAITALSRRSDLVYIYKPTPISMAGLLPKLFFGTPIVLDLDDLGSEVMVVQNQPRLMSMLVRLAEKLALRQADAVIVTSTYLKEVVQRAHPNKPILVLPNGVDPKKYQPAKGRLRPHIYYFGAVNRLSLVKPLLGAAPEILKSHPKASVSIIGGGSALEDARKLAINLGVNDKVKFSGWIPMEKIVDFIRKGDIAVCVQPDEPTVRAASNMKVFQYMSLGSVPVVSAVGDLPHYVEDCGVVVPPGDSRALAGAITQLLRQPEKRNMLSEATRRQAEQTYSWARLAEYLETFLSFRVEHERFWKEYRP
jgi:glycosyltransferase involved in cell wall biosynthesis